uniref:Uncharacterized protein n=1 Tax=Eptatretus burgeri TaxID=7764 RepID=A0A8C4Q2J6_EPTBU
MIRLFCLILSVHLILAVGAQIQQLRDIRPELADVIQAVRSQSVILKIPSCIVNGSLALDVIVIDQINNQRETLGSITPQCRRKRDIPIFDDVFQVSPLTGTNYSIMYEASSLQSKTLNIQTRSGKMTASKLEVNVQPSKSMLAVTIILAVFVLLLLLGLLLMIFL